MTEYEMGELLHNQFDTLWESSQMYFTLVSAYLVVAYLVGDKLTRKQYSIVTTLYLFWVYGVIQTQCVSGIGAIRLAEIISGKEGILLQYSHGFLMEFGIFGFTVVMVCGVFASLYFMWTVRHPKPI
ncbi:hypothetical protein E2F43_14950 [Seongchinamella unica]|uniref:Uncharacterized protein n=1 Tax=Seongchinamella unica TaxID=2547392 RepID=A0A4R5LQT4_9GAMM|nr:hypothetical protein [Seongchinamella unica]TDG12855.1 hypothetical protein E2F43_14950 [Seongchinamella unica]